MTSQVASAIGPIAAECRLTRLCSGSGSPKVSQLWPSNRVSRPILGHHSSHAHAESGNRSWAELFLPACHFATWDILPYIKRDIGINVTYSIRPHIASTYVHLLAR